MAGKNQVTLTFAGDSKSLEQTFDRVGAGAKTMGKETATGLDKVAVGARNAGRTAKGLQGALGGLVASGQGVAMIMNGDILGGLLALEGGFGKTALGAAKFALAGGRAIASFIADMASAAAAMAVNVAQVVAGWVVMGVQALINAAKMAVAWLISLGPIGLVIAAVGAVIAILVALGVNFDDIKRIAAAAWNFILGAARSVFNWLRTNWPLVLAIITGPIGLAVLAVVRNWDRIKSAFASAMGFVKQMATDAKTWIVNAFNGVVNFFTGLPGKVKGIFSSLGSSIVSGFKALWNNTIGGFGFSFKGFDPPGPGSIPGFSFKIPMLHSGGVFEAPRGQREGLAWLLDGERVSPAGAGASSGVTIHVHVAGSILSERQLIKIISDEFDRGGFR